MIGQPTQISSNAWINIVADGQMQTVSETNAWSSVTRFVTSMTLTSSTTEINPTIPTTMSATSQPLTVRQNSNQNQITAIAATMAIAGILHAFILAKRTRNKHTAKIS